MRDTESGRHSRIHHESYHVGACLIGLALVACAVLFRVYPLALIPIGLSAALLVYAMRRMK